MAEVSNWTESGRGPRLSAMCKAARGVGTQHEKTMTEWEAETGVGRMRWKRYEDGGSPRSTGDLWQVADVLGMSLLEMEAALDGKPAAPVQQGTLTDWAQDLSDTQFQRLCEPQSEERLGRWVSVITSILLRRIAEDKQDKSK